MKKKRRKVRNMATENKDKTKINFVEEEKKEEVDLIGRREKRWLQNDDVLAEGEEKEKGRKEERDDLLSVEGGR